MNILCFYVPVEFKEKVKDAIFAAGGGKIGNYDCCSFEVQGQGQFRPLKGSDPFLGQENMLQLVPEVRIELVCAAELIPSVIMALKASHPYETPAYHVIKALNY